MYIQLNCDILKDCDGQSCYIRWFNLKLWFMKFKNYFCFFQSSFQPKFSIMKSWWCADKVFPIIFIISIRKIIQVEVGNLNFWSKLLIFGIWLTTYEESSIYFYDNHFNESSKILFFEEDKRTKSLIYSFLIKQY